jgi:NAD(P)-dependent dehydrogenase (short-subunit alcohol dehydrogenase family)
MSESQDGGRRLRGRAALVTGASSGLGRATAIALAEAGADVALLARSAEELESAREEASTTGGRTSALPLDLAREDDAIRVIGQTVEAFGRIDVLVKPPAPTRPDR